MMISRSKFSSVFPVVLAAGAAPLFSGLMIASAARSSRLERAGRKRSLRPGSRRLGAALADAQVWAVAGRWDARTTVAASKTDASGRFVLPGISKNEAAMAAIARGDLGLYALAPDGRVGWLAKVDRSEFADEKNTVQIIVSPVGDVRGRVIDQRGRPIKSAKLTPFLIIRRGAAGTDDTFIFGAEAVAAYRTETLDDGSFVLKHVPRGARVQTSVEAPGIGWLHFLWDTTREVTFTFDDRLGQIKGRVNLPAAPALPGQILVKARLAEPAAAPSSGSYQKLFSTSVPAGKDGSFQLTSLPPGRYRLDLDCARMRRWPPSDPNM